ncbi:VacJ family lipoprotein [Caulobacter sp. CCH9-E1]|jgi:phospholipid-binding lipoprotein MlaA|uniref:MlaA family lipoprotein n=1 Tax=Caulobacter sp. CCH9-E1 TaxID=1768768 RepID=UPI001E58F1FD|nr:MlaA family lipoprotein [Caulobacter sp. CCH9-E1]
MSLSHQDQSARRKAAGRRMTAAGLTVAAGLLALAPAAHAAHQAPAPAGSVSANDPLEGFNRGAFKLGMGLDKVLLAPIAHGYMAVTPKPVRDRVSSAVYNLGEPNTVINMVLQGKPKRAMRSTTRFVVNSTVGVLGLFDVASKMHLPRRDSDFGQTFGYYGAGPGAYIYVPLMGPLNVRDGIGRALDMATDPVGAVAGGIGTDFGKARLGVTIVDVRTQADPAFHALKDSSDPYVTVRSAYGQYREAFIRQATGEAEDLPDFDAPPPDASAPPATPNP